MAEYTTAAPTLETATRLSNGGIKVTWTNRATSHTAYTRVWLFARKVGSGLWRQANSWGYPVISNQQYAQYTAPGGALFADKVNEQWEFMLRAQSVKGGVSPDSNSRQVAAESTKAPSFTDAFRRSQTAVRLEFDPQPNNAARPDKTYAFMRVKGSGGVFRQVNATSSPTDRYLDIGGLDGSTEYEFELMSSGPGGPSPRSSRRTVGVWWDVPAGVTDLAGAWQGAASIKLTWTGNPSTRGPYNTQEVWRAEGTLGQLARVATIAGTKRDYTDTGADPAKQYRYEVVPVSPAGRATQRPTATVAAALDAPAPPTGVSVVYVATDRAKVSWTTKATAQRPYTSQRVLYRLQGSTTWQTAATVSAAATEYTHTLGANRVAEYAVEAVNAAGTAASDPAGPVATTPARPATLTAAWSGPTSITVTWPSVSTVADAFMVEFSTDNTTWYPAPTDGPLQPRGGSWVHQNVTPTVPHWYRLNATKASIVSTPASSWVLSGAVEALTKPLPPTLLTPEVLDAAEAVELRFLHNPVDGTAQTGARVRFRIQGTSTWTTRTLTTADFTTINAGTYTNGDVLEVQAQTAGDTGEYSDWSATMLVTLRARPVVGSVTNSTPNSSTVTTTWTATGQATALVELLNSTGQVVEARTVGAATRTTTWTGLVDQSVHNTRVTVSDQWQKSLPFVSDVFQITLVRPAKPSATAAFRTEDGSVLITATLGAGTDRAEVWRGPHLVGDVVSGMVIDNHAPLGRPALSYTVRAYGTEGGFIDSDPATVATTACDVYLTWSGGVCRGGWDPSISGTAGRHSVAHRYVGDDDGPSFSYGQKQARILDVTVTIDTSTGDTPLTEWVAAAEDARVVYRDPSGRVMNGTLTGFRYNDSDALEQQVTFTVTQRPDTASGVVRFPMGA